jgi:hypothetical protein
MVQMYADLVELGLRVLEPEVGQVAVPSFLREAVKAELVKRGFIKVETV